MPSVNEDVNEEEKEEDSSSSPSAKPGATPQSLQRIPSGDDDNDNEISTPGPVTNARAQRGEIPIRGGKPGSKQETTKTKEDGGGQSDEMMKQDGLKLRLELNLDIELELKASIRGDITLALL